MLRDLALEHRQNSDLQVNQLPAIPCHPAPATKHCQHAGRGCGRLVTAFPARFAADNVNEPVMARSAAPRRPVATEEASPKEDVCALPSNRGGGEGARARTRFS